MPLKQASESGGRVTGASDSLPRGMHGGRGKEGETVQVTADVSGRMLSPHHSSDSLLPSLFDFSREVLSIATSSAQIPLCAITFTQLFLFYHTHRETRTTADLMCLGTQLRLLDSRSFLERSPDGQRSPAVLDPTGAVAVAGVHHAGRHLSLPPSSDHHRLLLLSRRVHHLAEGTLHGSRGSQVLVDDADK